MDVEPVPTASVTALPRVLVAGLERPTHAAELIGLVVDQRLDTVGRCEFRLSLPGLGSGPDRTALALGASLRVELPDGPQDATEAFVGRITGLTVHVPGDRPPELLVVAEDGLRALRTGPRSRTFAGHRTRLDVRRGHLGEIDHEP